MKRTILKSHSRVRTDSVTESMKRRCLSETLTCDSPEYPKGGTKDTWPNYFRRLAPEGNVEKRPSSGTGLELVICTCRGTYNACTKRKKFLFISHMQSYAFKSMRVIPGLQTRERQTLILKPCSQAEQKAGAVRGRTGGPVFSREHIWETVWYPVAVSWRHSRSRGECSAERGVRAPLGSERPGRKPGTGDGSPE